MAILAAQLVGLVATLFILVPGNEALPPVAALAWAAAAGLSGIVGLGAYYVALSRGTMGLIAPLAALIGASLPALVAIVGGEDVGPMRLAGIGLGLVAVVLISLPGGERTDEERRLVRLDIEELPLVVVSGLGFAGFYLGLDLSASEGGETIWPLLAVRVVGVAVALGAVAVLLTRLRRQPLRRRAATVLGIDRLRALPVSATWVVPLFIVAGLGDLGGNAFFILANAVDALSVAVVLSSLYPVITTVLAAVFLHERLRPLQVLGIALAVVAVVLIGR